MTYDEIRAAIGASPLRASRLPRLRHECSHIAAERDAVADWDCLHRMTQCN